MGLKVASKHRWKNAFTLRFLLGGGCCCDVKSSELTSPPLPTCGIGVADDGGGGIPSCDVVRVLFLANSPPLLLLSRSLAASASTAAEDRLLRVEDDAATAHGV